MAEIMLVQAKTGEYSPEEGLVNGVVRFGKIDKAFMQLNLFLPRQLLQSMNHEHHIIDGRTVVGNHSVCSFGRIPTRSQYSRRRRAMILRIFFPVCAANERPL